MKTYFILHLSISENWKNTIWNYYDYINYSHYQTFENIWFLKNYQRTLINDILICFFEGNVLFYKLLVIFKIQSLFTVFETLNRIFLKCIRFYCVGSGKGEAEIEVRNTQPEPKLKFLKKVCFSTGHFLPTDTGACEGRGGSKSSGRASGRSWGWDWAPWRFQGQAAGGLRVEDAARLWRGCCHREALGSDPGVHGWLWPW